MVNTFVPANLQWVGAARETTYGTAVATPTVFFPVDTPQYHQVRPPLVDSNLRGSMGGEFQQIQGMLHDELSFKTYGYLDSVYFLVRAALGYPDTMTGSSDPYTHKTALQNTGNNGQPVSSTLFWTDGAGKSWQMPGSQIAEVKITGKTDGLYTLDVKWVGLPATIITAPTNTPSTATPWPSWNSTLTLAGTPETVYSEIDITIKRATEIIPTITGTQTPYAVFVGACTIAGSITAVYQGSTDVHLTEYMANTQPILVWKTSPVGDATHYLQLTMSKVAYDDLQITGSNKWVELKATIKALSNSTDALDGVLSPLQAVFLSPASTAI